MAHVDFWFDYSSPYAYFASRRIEAIVEETGATLAWKPMLLGGVFKTLDRPVVPLLAQCEAKQRYLREEMDRFARWWEIPFEFPTKFPMRTIKALRITMLLDDPVPFIHHCFEAYWARDRDISDPQTLKELLREVDADPALLERTAEAEVKQKLIDATTAAVEAGVFGAPTCIVGGRLFWGQDRLELVKLALQGWQPKLPDVG